MVHRLKNMVAEGAETAVEGVETDVEGAATDVEHRMEDRRSGG